ncbi:hypothetical protein CEXT_686541 [Caerostris extrusa]|uniref:Uncharacterized protein n=1 Tax=Caerostris extrusa TaxID=172846 RepID=A0AAV4VAQ8_CAEEX|nr:hypothetical protein CEXT_686541 [Caerostris extrusa]
MAISKLNVNMAISQIMMHSIIRYVSRRILLKNALDFQLWSSVQNLTREAESNLLYHGKGHDVYHWDKDIGDFRATSVEWTPHPRHLGYSSIYFLEPELGIGPS